MLDIAVSIVGGESTDADAGEELEEEDIKVLDNTDQTEDEGSPGQARTSLVN